MARSSLAKYRKMRDFERTAEPRGAAPRARAKGRAFFVQKHAARRMHHDFRLELDGVLKSWAVPKGLPRAPGEKTLAVEVEDHPLEYGAFEGVIPQGEYGGGTVMLWDRGSWQWEDEPRAALASGKLSFRLDGERLRGRWTLVRTGGGAGKASKTSWLLIKRSDERGEPSSAPPATLDESVASGRSMREIATAADRTWSSARETRARASKGRRPSARSPAKGRTRRRVELPRPSGAREGPPPRGLSPMLATLVDAPPAGDGWLHELKYDGYRLLARVADGAVRLRTRHGHDWTARFPSIAGALGGLGLGDAVLDGEVVVLGKDGASDFQALQSSLGARPARGSQHVFYAFDLPYCAGLDLTASPLVERKELLRALLARASGEGAVRFSEHVAGDGPAFLREVCALNLEGVVSKRADSPYVARRSGAWLKSKCLARQEFVVGGWSEPAGARNHFGALLLGVNEDGALRYAGRVGTGFTERSLAELARVLAPLEIERPPFANPPRGAGARGVHWVRPERVAEVAFSGWTQDGVLRHPTFQGLREDKRPAEVKRERAVSAPRGARRAASARAAPARVPAAARDRALVADVRLTHPERVLYPETGLTKSGLAEYLVAVAGQLLPHVAHRPVTIVRCPRGHGEKCFYQKNLKEGMPAELRAIPVAIQGEELDYVGVDDVRGLVALVQIGVLELHPWGSREDKLDVPDRLVFDLDPAPDVAWGDVVAATRRVREVLSALGLESFLRTTGGKGLHVVVPIERRTPWPAAKEFTHDVARAIARGQEERFVLKASKAARKGRIFLDYLRNDRGATAIASYSPRARPGAPVACPLAWNELDERLDPRTFTVESVPARLASVGDPWRGFFELRQALSKAMLAAVRRV